MPVDIRSSDPNQAAKIIPAADRTAAPRGAKALIVGPTGVGKTSLLRTLDLASTLFVDVEAGDIVVQDLAVDTFRPRTWPQCRDLAVVLAGPNPAAAPDAAYSAAHYDAAIAELGTPRPYQTFFVDSLTAVGRLCFAWASQQPESFSERSGKRDLRGAYDHPRDRCCDAGGGKIRCARGLLTGARTPRPRLSGSKNFRPPKSPKSDSRHGALPVSTVYLITGEMVAARAGAHGQLLQRMQGTS
jgi:hypothetical protein